MAQGDHFFVWRHFRGVPFQHHAIDIGDGSAVHFADPSGAIAGPGADASRFAILRTSLESISLGTPAALHVVEHAVRQTREETIRRALSRVGALTPSRYDLVFNNCEHFAMWCAVGLEESRQVAVACERAVSIGFKAAAQGAFQFSAKVGLKRAAGVASPWLLASDAVQWLTEAGGHHAGLKNPRVRRRAGRLLGGAVALGIGASGGAVAAAVAGGTWLAAELAGAAGTEAYARLRKARVSDIVNDALGSPAVE